VRNKIEDGIGYTMTVTLKFKFPYMIQKLRRLWSK